MRAINNQILTGYMIVQCVYVVVLVNYVVDLTTHVLSLSMTK